MGDNCIMGLLLGTAVGVDEQGKEDATVEPCGHHVELLSSAIQDRECQLQSAIFLLVPTVLFSVPCPRGQRCPGYIRDRHEERGLGWFPAHTKQL